MKEKKNGLTTILFAFAGLLAKWLIQEHFVQLVALWKQAKAKTNGETSPLKSNSDESVSQ